MCVCVLCWADVLISGHQTTRFGLTRARPDSDGVQTLWGVVASCFRHSRCVWFVKQHKTMLYLNCKYIYVFVSRKGPICCVFVYYQWSRCTDKEDGINKTIYISIISYSLYSVPQNTLLIQFPSICINLLLRHTATVHRLPKRTRNYLGGCLSQQVSLLGGPRVCTRLFIQMHMITSIYPI